MAMMVLGAGYEIGIVRLAAKPLILHRAHVNTPDVSRAHRAQRPPDRPVFRPFCGILSRAASRSLRRCSESCPM